MNGPRSLSTAPVSHLPGWRGRVGCGGAGKPCTAVRSAVLALALLAIPLPAPGQQPATVYRIGWLVGGRSPKDATPQTCPGALWQPWVQAMRERGYTPGQNLVIECRWT